MTQSSTCAQWVYSQEAPGHHLSASLTLAMDWHSRHAKQGHARQLYTSKNQKALAVRHVTHIARGGGVKHRIIRARAQPANMHHAYSIQTRHCLPEAPKGRSLPAGQSTTSVATPTATKAVWKAGEGKHTMRWQDNNTPAHKVGHAGRAQYMQSRGTQRATRQDEM